MMEFEPSTIDVIQNGQTAALLLATLNRVCTELVEGVLKKIDQSMASTHGGLTPEQCVAWVAEIAAYRRIITHQKREITVGQNAARRAQNG